MDGAPPREYARVRGEHDVGRVPTPQAGAGAQRRIAVRVVETVLMYERFSESEVQVHVVCTALDHEPEGEVRVFSM